MVYTVGMFYPLIVKKDSQILTSGRRHEQVADFFCYPGIPQY
jgi:hypothetical protein